MTMQITSDRGRLAALTNIVTWQEPGNYQLPEDVLKAAGVLAAAQALTVADPPAQRHLQDVASGVVDVLERGEPIDPAALAAQTTTARDLAAKLDMARSLIGLAIESAAQRAVASATAAADRIIVGCLQPAYEALLAEARQVAPALHGHDLAAGGWGATKKQQEARRILSELADRHQLLRQARVTCIGLSGQLLQHDTQDQFALLREPQAFTPGYTANRPLPRPDVPADPVAALRWLVSDGASGKPWLPTTSEQDQAWLSLFGAALDQRRAASVSARAHAGMRV
ncbi:MAG: hypothetical protein WKF51_11535 [Geodermatophilaceae bacterium]